MQPNTVTKAPSKGALTNMYHNTNVFMYLVSNPSSLLLSSLRSWMLEPYVSGTVSADAIPKGSEPELLVSLDMSWPTQWPLRNPINFYCTYLFQVRNSVKVGWEVHHKISKFICGTSCHHRWFAFPLAGMAVAVHSNRSSCTNLTIIKTKFAEKWNCLLFFVLWKLKIFNPCSWCQLSSFNNCIN